MNTPLNEFLLLYNIMCVIYSLRQHTLERKNFNSIVIPIPIFLSLAQYHSYNTFYLGFLNFTKVRLSPVSTSNEEPSNVTK